MSEYTSWIGKVDGNWSSLQLSGTTTTTKTNHLSAAAIDELQMIWLDATTTDGAQRIIILRGETDTVRIDGA